MRILIALFFCLVLFVPAALAQDTPPPTGDKPALPIGTVIVAALLSAGVIYAIAFPTKRESA
jgi:hypothetical protein